MEFHYNLLEQTKKEIKSMEFFKENIVISSDEYEVIHDFEQAYDNAFTNGFKYGEYSRHTWVDILEDNMAMVKKIIYDDDNYKELSKIVRDLRFPELNEIEYTFYDADVVEEIGNEIELCAKSRFICGKENVFFESLFKAYKLGAWPCGWNSDSNKLIVYVPENE